MRGKHKTSNVGKTENNQSRKNKTSNYGKTLDIQLWKNIRHPLRGKHKTSNWGKLQDITLLQQRVDTKNQAESTEEAKIKMPIFLAAGAACEAIF